MNSLGTSFSVNSINEYFSQQLFKKNIYIDFFGFSGLFLFIIGIILYLIFYIKMINKSYNNNDDQKIKDINNATIVTSTGGLLFLFVFIGSKIFKNK